MTEIVRWEPFRELAGLRREMERWFGRSEYPYFYRDIWSDAEKVPLDAYYTDDALVIKGSLPGVSPEEVSITLDGDTLTIRGETKQEERTEREGYLCQERHYGSFYRSLALPRGLKTDKAEATFEDGVLTLTIPKSEEIKPKQIKVKASGVLGTTKKKRS